MPFEDEFEDFLGDVDESLTFLATLPVVGALFAGPAVVEPFVVADDFFFDKQAAGLIGFLISLLVTLFFVDEALEEFGKLLDKIEGNSAAFAMPIVTEPSGDVNSMAAPAVPGGKNDDSFAPLFPFDFELSFEADKGNVLNPNVEDESPAADFPDADATMFPFRIFSICCAAYFHEELEFNFVIIL
jgi:hypothetical protein